MTQASIEHWGGKRVLITGGTGFIGTALTNRLRSYGAEVTSIGSKECNLENRNWVDRFFGTQIPKMDYIFHMAAWTMPGEFCLHHSAEQYIKNTLIHVNVLEAWKNCQPQAKLIGIGSSCSYPGHLEVLSEKDYWNGNPHESLHAYAMTKRMLYAGQLAYAKQYGLWSVHVVFTTVYGAGDYFDEQRSHCASALIRRFCVATKKHLPEVMVWGDGTQEREFVYIDDQIDGLLIAAERSHFLSLVNLGSGQATTIKTLAETIKKHSGFKGRVVYDPKQFVGIHKKRLDSALAKKELGWSPQIAFDDGIKKTVDWYYANREQDWT